MKYRIFFIDNHRDVDTFLYGILKLDYHEQYKHPKSINDILFTAVTLDENDITALKLKFPNLIYHEVNEEI